MSTVRVPNKAKLIRHLIIRNGVAAGMAEGVVHALVDLRDEGGPELLQVNPISPGKQSVTFGTIWQQTSWASSLVERNKEKENRQNVWDRNVRAE